MSRISFKLTPALQNNLWQLQASCKNSTSYACALIKDTLQKNLVMLHYPLLLFSGPIALILSGMSEEWTIPQYASCQSLEYIYS